MKPEVLQTLLTAKVLFNKAQDICFVEDKYTASSGLIILQDALELILLAALMELGVDEKKSIENFSFDQLIGELKKEGITVIKSGTLKALNKQRVIIKHYGQVSEPQTVGTYFEVVRQSADSILEQTIGKTINQIALCETIQNEETRGYLEDACEALDQEKYFKCLSSIRKAIFVEIEIDYCVYDFRDSTLNDPWSLWGLGKNGRNAPDYTKNKDWIDKNVKDPFDYIQRDHDKIRQDLLEWGASTQDFWNIWRLTPEIMRLEKDGDWLLKGELKHLYQAATKENATFCLDRAVTLLAKKQSHHDMARWLYPSKNDQLRVRLKENSTLFEKASYDSGALINLTENSIYDANSIVYGLDGKEKFVNISHIQEEDQKYIGGYVAMSACELLEPNKEDS